MVVRRGPYLAKHSRATAMIRFRTSVSLSGAAAALVAICSRYRPGCPFDKYRKCMRICRPRIPGEAEGMKTLARLTVALLAALLAATACGSRLGTGDLEADNGVLTKHSTAAPGAGAAGG